MKRLVSMALLLAVVAIPAGASTFLVMDQKALVQDSAAVVQGRVLQINSFWDPTGTVVKTEALVQVDDVIFGESPSVVVIETFGGKVGNFYVEAHGFPTFAVNEELLLFLEAEKDGVQRVAGYQQGQYRIVRDNSGIEMAVPAFDAEANLLTKDGRPAARPQVLRLSTLKSQIRAEADRAGRVAN
ncbi:MAG TPA: hypothetical protein VMW27_25135 [Thermoanaerobaculia bacterium]|nr:hypothetical protein [Thermoanaerobaculia bacterium]